MMPKELGNRIFTIEEAARNGVSRAKLAGLVQRGELERLARGVYARPAAANVPLIEAAVLARRGTNFVLSLESALRLHGFTTAMPHALWIALRRGTRKPAVDFPIESVLVDVETYEEGVEKRDIGGVEVRVYSCARTVADLFKFRNRVGLDLALETLKDGFRQNRFTADELMRFARLDRVGNVIRPYLEGYFG